MTTAGNPRRFKVVFTGRRVEAGEKLVTELSATGTEAHFVKTDLVTHTRQPSQ